MGGTPGMGGYDSGTEDDGLFKKKIIFRTTQGLTVPMKIGMELTIDEALKEFFREVEKPELIGTNTNRFAFLYNGNLLKFGDSRTIFEFFSQNDSCPKVVVNDIYNLIGDSYIHSQLRKENNKLNQQISNLNQIKDNLQRQLFQANLVNEEKYKKEINDLKSRLSRYENNIEVNLGDLVVINFESGDGQIRRGIQCMKNEIFAIAEEKLYKFYEAFRDTNNKFTVNEIEIKRFKTIEENNIKDGDKVVLETI